jgi:hypothetical protein
MDTTWKGQFGGAINMIENGLMACPEELWSDRQRHVQHHAKSSVIQQQTVESVPRAGGPRMELKETLLSKPLV